TQLRQAPVQRLFRCVAHLPEPGVVRRTVDEEIAPHLRADRKHGQIRRAVDRPLGKVGHGWEGERCAVDRRDVEADRNRMTGAGDRTCEAGRVAQADIQAAGEHDKARGDFLAVGQHDRLPLRAGRDRGGLGLDDGDRGRDCGSHGVD
ncbi:hypothetical protein CEE86_14550, partial [Lactobacillus crispatus]